MTFPGEGFSLSEKEKMEIMRLIEKEKSEEGVT